MKRLKFQCHGKNQTHPNIHMDHFFMLFITYSPFQNSNIDSIRMMRDNRSGDICHSKIRHLMYLQCLF